MTVLIAGANGQIGQHLVKRLVKAGHTVKAGVRAPEQISDMRDLGAEGVLLDLTKPELFPSALEGVDQVAFTAGSGGEAVEAVDRDGAISLIDATVQAGIPRFVMLSSVMVDEPEKGPDGLKDYLKAKQVADNHLKGTDLSYTIIRPVALTNDAPTGKIKTDGIEFANASIPRADVAHALQVAAELDNKPRDIIEIASGDAAIEQSIGGKVAA